MQKELEKLLHNIRERAEFLKSDEVVDDDTCDGIVEDVHEIIEILGKNGFSVKQVEPLEPSAYQED